MRESLVASQGAMFYHADMSSEQIAEGSEPGKVDYTTKVMVWLVLGGAILRLLYFATHTSSVFFAVPLLDQQYYHLCARELADMGVTGLIDGFRPLLYPMFLSVFYTLGGTSGIILSIFAQHILGIGIAVMVAWLAMRLFDDWRAGALGGALYLLAGPPLFFEGEILIVTLFTFLLMLAALLTYKAIHAQGRKAVVLWLAVGVTAGFAAQARPNALLVLAAYPILALYLRLQKRRTASLLPLCVLVSALAVQACFGLINARYTGRFSIVTSAGGINFYVGNKRGADGMIPRQARSVTYEGDYRDSMQVASEVLYREAMRRQGSPASEDPAEISDFWVSETLQEIKAAPAQWCKLMLKKCWLLLWNYEVSNNRNYAFIIQEESKLLRFLPVRWWLLLALLPWGIWSARKRPERPFVFWSGCFAGLYVLSVVAFFVNSRFRIPLWPMAAIYAGGGLVTIKSVLREQGKRRPAVGLCIASVLLVTLSLVNWAKVEPEDFSRAYYFRSRAGYEKARFDESVNDALKSVTLDPANADAHLQLGNALFALGRYKDAVSAYLQAVRLDPAEPRTHNNLGAALENAGRYAEAYESYRNALRVRPTHDSALINTALLELRAGMLEEAEESIALAEEQGVQRADLFCARAYLEHLRKKPGSAQLVERAKQADPQLMDSLLNREEKVTRELLESRL